MKDVNFSGLQNNKEVTASQNLSIKCTGDHGARAKRKPTLYPPCLFEVMLIVIAGIVFWELGRRRRRTRAAAGLLPPGSVGLPVVGETLRLIAAYKTEDPEPFIDERVRRHGRLFTTHVFGERTVFSADPEFNRMVLGAEGRAVECSYPSSISTLLGAHSLLLMRGARHRRMHSLILTRLASPAAIRDAALLPHIDRHVRRTLDSWSSSPSSSPSRVLLLDQAKKITFELTVMQLVSFDSGEWTESLRREYLLLIEGFFSIPFPSFLFFTTYGRALKVYSHHTSPSHINPIHRLII
ncbi:hypothetical protein BHE74_00050503 [Ensete ventricosum]|nr:hypothetical protein GW17_00059151 [Ensete ventricosum]RWW43790.1 hypothetical protein BHE74_00050503 [Ensete ventricosum]